MTVAVVTGARGDAVPPELVWSVLDACAPSFVILGDCPSGVDAAAWRWCVARLRDEQYVWHWANWARYGNSAGPHRNAAMVADAVARRAGGADVLVLAFPRGGPGTQDCMVQARAAGLEIWEF